jgi:hypothetical protein
MKCSLACLASVLVMMTAFAGCDSSARSTDPNERALFPEGESLANESCATSSQCSDELRCIDGVCLAGDRSRLGDFHAAAGRRALAAGDSAKAAQSYNSAVTQYEQEKLTPPVDVLCEQGMAMAEGRADAKLAEAAARILHKCILVVPGNSSLARRALNALASLTEVGLDPELLARNETADLYMTGQAEQPDLSSLVLKVSTEGKKNNKRGFASLVTALEAPASKQAMASCWQSYWKRSKKEQLRVVVPFEYRYILDEDDESRDRAILSVGELSSPSDADLAAASQCVVSAAGQVAAEVVKSMRDDTRWKTSVAIQIGS